MSKRWKIICSNSEGSIGCIATSVTRLGDLLQVGQLFKASGSNHFDRIAHVLSNFCKGVKIFQFSSRIIFGQLLQIFGNFLLVTLIATYFLTQVLFRLGYINLGANLWREWCQFFEKGCLKAPTISKIGWLIIEFWKQNACMYAHLEQP